MKKKISIMVNGKFHAIDLANYIFKKNQLGLLIICYPKFKFRKQIFNNEKIKTFGFLYILQIILSKIDFFKKFSLNYYIISLFDFLTSLIINKKNTDLLICWASTCSITIKKCKRVGIKTIVLRGSTHIDHQIKILKKQYKKYNLKFNEHNFKLLSKEKLEYHISDFIEVPSKNCKKTFTNLKIPSQKMIVLSRGVYVDLFKKKNISALKPKNIIFVGNTIIRKGLLYLIDSLKFINFDFNLNIVGSVNYNQLYKLRGEILDRYNVNFTGHLNQDDLIEQYQNADIFCLPSLEEGMSNVILQAMSCSLPVIVTDVSGGEDIIENFHDGIIIKSENSYLIQKNLNELYNNDGLRYKISVNARKKILRNFQKEDIFKKTLNTYLGKL